MDTERSLTDTNPTPYLVDRRVCDDFELELDGTDQDFLASETIEYYLVDVHAFPEEDYISTFTVFMRELAAVSAHTPTQITYLGPPMSSVNSPPSPCHSNAREPVMCWTPEQVFMGVPALVGFRSTDGRPIDSSLRIVFTQLGFPKYMWAQVGCPSPVSVV
jgi:hypothetical protein